MTTKYQTYSTSQWQSIMEDFANSGLTQIAFCQQQDLAMSTFSKWRKQLGLVDRQAHSEVATFKPLTPEWSGASILDAVSAPAAGDAEAMACAHWQVELSLGSGVVLRIHAEK